MHKSIKVHHVLLITLVDTESDSTIFNINAPNKLGPSAFKNYSGVFTAFDNSNIKPLGYFKVSMTFDV